MVYSITSSVSPSSMRLNEEKVVKESQEEANIDLNLSLSLNGKFGVDPQRNRGTYSHPKVLVTPDERSSPICDENGAELKMSHSLDSQGSNSFSIIQCIEDLQENPANIGCSNGDETVAASKAIPEAADEVEGRVFNNADMPYVFTTVHGQKIEGFLSKYEQEENITIICACHGCSMSPAEFIKHAGGGDVSNPFRHIKVDYALGGGNGVNPLN